MCIRCAFFEGRVNPGCENTFEGRIFHTVFEIPHAT